MERVELAGIGVHGFRNLNSDIPLRPFTVLIGPNGSGKSSVLDAIRLVEAALDGDIAKCLNDWGRFDSVIHQNAGLLHVDHIWRFGDDKAAVYSLDLQRSATSFAVDKESLRTGLGDAQIFLEGFSAGNDNQTVAFSRSADGHVSISEPYTNAANPELRGERHVASTKLFVAGNDWIWTAAGFANRPLRTLMYLSSPLRLDPKSPLRSPQMLNEPSSLLTDGSNLVSVIFNMRTQAPDCYERLIDTIRAAFTNFDRFEFEAVGSGYVVLQWYDNRLNAPLRIHQLSDGTIRFLWLATLLCAEPAPDMILIDEPEIGLHPEMQRILVELLREASERTQVVVATHSDRFVRFCSPAELVVANLEFGDEHPRFVRGDDPELNIDHWIDEYSLDELWSKGVLGGRP